MGKNISYNMENIKLKLIKSTPFGPVAIIWSLKKYEPLINLIILSHPQESAGIRVSKLYRDIKRGSCPEIDEVSSKIKSFLRGENILFSLDRVDLESCTPFQRSVLEAEYNIPRGRITSYKTLASYLGKDKGARAIGNALARNPFPVIIPCHRAIRFDGYLGGFQGGEDMKRALLEAEGIIFDHNGRVICKDFYYE